MWKSEKLAREVIVLHPEKIKGKQRHRSSKYVPAYYKLEDKLEEDFILAEWIEKVGFKYRNWDDEVHLRIIYARQLPSSKPKYRNGEPDLYKPDIDNVAKLVIDALNGTAFKDDSQITSLSLEKAKRFSVASLSHPNKDFLRIEVTYIRNEVVR